MRPEGMIRVCDGVKYDTDKAEIIASDEYWDGHYFERDGRNTHLFKTPKGRFFATYLSMWEGDVDTLEPIVESEAIEIYDGLPEKEISFEEAFPDEVVEEA